MNNPGSFAFPPEDANYPVRVSELGGFKLLSLGDSSIVQFGDRAELRSSLRALAVHRETDHRFSSEVYFESYPIFSRPRMSFPEFPDPFGEGDRLRMRKRNASQRICVGTLSVIAISAAASIQVGNALTATCESRVKDIRQYAGPIPAPPLRDR